MTDSLKTIILNEILRLSKIMHDGDLPQTGCDCGKCRDNMISVFSFIINRLVMLFIGRITISDFHDGLDDLPEQMRVFYFNLLFESYV